MEDNLPTIIDITPTEIIKPKKEKKKSSNWLMDAMRNAAQNTKNLQEGKITQQDILENGGAAIAESIFGTKQKK